MSQKNLNVQNKTHKFLLDKLKDSRTLQIYKKFESNLPSKKNFVVAVSGGPDSLALSFLAKIYSIKKSIDIKYFIVCLLYTSPSPRDRTRSRMPSSA